MATVRHSSLLSSLLRQVLLLFYLLDSSLSIPIDFQVGGYLQKFFKDILPNNTNYKRKPGDEEPYKKYYTQVLSTSPLPTIEGLSFKYADQGFPTLPVYYGNLTFGTYKFQMETTFDTTPNKENLLKIGDVFRDVIMKKSGFLKNMAGAYRQALQENSTHCGDYKDIRNVEENYDERLEEVLDRVKKKMHQRVEAHYNRSTTESSTDGLYNNFMAQFKEAYQKQVDAIAEKSSVPVEPVEADSTTMTTIALTRFPIRKSVEEREKEALEGLEALEKEFVTRADLEEELKDIITPGPHEEE